MERYPKMFEDAFKLILELEGGYTNSPYDPGRETKYGISKKAFPDVDIKNLTVEDAKKIYYENYWAKADCEKIDFKYAVMVFDTAVNMGVLTAKKTLQIAINSQRGPKEQIVVDGIIGPKTLKALEQSYSNLLLVDFARHRTNKYFTKVRRNPRLQMFLKGWINRVYKVLRFIYGK